MGSEMEKWVALNIYPENSCSIACADRGQQLEVITHGTPVEVTKPLALGNVTAVATVEFRPKIEKQPREHSGLFCCQQACRERAALRELSCADIR
jgi:hypothetical protein